MRCRFLALGLLLLFASSSSILASSGRLGGTPREEDPEVAAYFKKKGWWLIRDLRIADGKRIVILTVQHKDKLFEDVNLTDDDLKTIARSKTVQLLDLRKVKNLGDDGLKTVAAIPQLKGILIGSEKVTDAGLEELAAAKSLESVSLMFTKKVTDRGVRQLAALPKLRWLALMGMTLSGSAFEAFAGSKTLEAVSLEYVEGLTDEGVKHLGALPRLNELKIGVGFGASKLTSAGIKAIVESHMPARLDFNHKLIDDDLLELLVKKGWLYGPTPPGVREKKPATAAEVQVINLTDSKVTDRGMRAVLDCTGAADVFLERTGITDATLEKLSGFKRLRYLALGSTRVTGAGLEAIAALPIKHIALQECELSEEAFKALGKMKLLEELWLSDARMKAGWLEHIARLPKLRDLNLMRADFDDAAVDYVVSLPALQSLTVNNTKLGDAGFRRLVELPRLRSLYVDGTKVSKEVYQKARKEHPRKILYYYQYDR